jgi:hypothetical protein
MSDNTQKLSQIEDGPVRPSNCYRGANGFGQLGDALLDFYPADRHVRASGNNEYFKLGFQGSSKSKPTNISFRRRTPSEINELKKKRDEARRNLGPNRQLPFLTKPPRSVQTSNSSQVP